VSVAASGVFSKGPFEKKGLILAPHPGSLSNSRSIKQGVLEPRQRLSFQEYLNGFGHLIQTGRPERITLEPSENERCFGTLIEQHSIRSTTSLKASTLFEVTKVCLRPPTNGREESHRLINIYTHFVQNGDSGWRMPLASISTKY
jgi:hypothetical protein